MLSRYRITIASFFLSVFVMSTHTYATSIVESVPLTGLDIMRKVEAVDEGDRQISDISMLLIDKHGSERVRHIKAFRKRIGNSEHSVSFFTSPADIKGTGFLTVEYTSQEKDDDQWLYLPALNRTKRIPASEMSSPFMGSDFNYSDMSDSRLEDYHYSLKGETEVNGAPVWVIESEPVSDKIAEDTGYKKTVSFVDKSNFIVVRAVRWTDKGNKVKYFEVKELEKIDGVWTPLAIEMTTKQSKAFIHKTVFRFSNIKYNQDLDDDLFTVRRIEKGV